MTTERELLQPVAARIAEVVPEGTAGHSLWLEPRRGWEEPPQPGQFLMLWLPDSAERQCCDSVPMSVAGWEKGRLMVTIADLGPTTKALLQCKVGEQLGVTGPLGHGFDWTNKERLLLVAGGVGAPPLRYLAERVREEGLEVHTILGARSEGALFSRTDLAKFSHELNVATDDGSAGHHGFVTELLDKVASRLEPDLLCSCGPEPMLVKVLEWTEQQRPEPIPCQLCLERYMGCGVGICGVCTVDELLVCHDGPVLTGTQLRDSQEFGKVVRGPGGKLV